jgi:MoxR-like ATPase
LGEARVHEVRNYIKKGKLWQAFDAPARVVLLIDEIDKADLEFANDLLHELDRMSFVVDETGETHTAIHRPVVIITSNNEKELPDAFLRRCVFHYIAFPEESQMREIVNVHHPRLQEQLLSTALTRFYWLRKQPDLKKRPSTSELIDWISALHKTGVDVDKLSSEIPFVGLLLKKESDVQQLINVKDSARGLKM